MSETEIAIPFIKHDLKEACKVSTYVSDVKTNIGKTSAFIGRIQNHGDAGLDYGAIICAVAKAIEPFIYKLKGYKQDVTETEIADLYVQKIQAMMDFNKETNNTNKDENDMTEKVKSMFDKLMPDSVLGKVCTAIVLFVIGKKVWKSKTVQNYWQKLQDLVEDVTNDEEGTETDLRDS